MDASSRSLPRQSSDDKLCQQARIRRDELRDSLSKSYQLRNYDIFFVQSVKMGKVILSHLLCKREATLSLAKHAHYQPASELFYPPAAYFNEPGSVPIITHVDPDTGTVNALDHSHGQGIVDASHSFATRFHRQLIAHSSIFIAPLNTHASLAEELAIIALRPEHFSTLMRSELLLFEASTVSHQPLYETLENIRSLPQHSRLTAGFLVDKGP